MQRRPTLCSERKNQNRALRKGWGTLDFVKGNKTGRTGGPPVREELRYPFLSDEELDALDKG